MTTRLDPWSVDTEDSRFFSGPIPIPEAINRGHLDGRPGQWVDAVVVRPIWCRHLAFNFFPDEETT